MKDFIRSPLQFVRPMTKQEWQELMLRRTHRETQRERRRRAREKAKLIAPLASRRLKLIDLIQAADSSVGL